ncbi:RNA degradosome polyphosphate kinase [uncultured Methanobrevibacter sp.]|uniref:RNA degradosome polyphosphate kinase n=1 Tax=uncultured Methanobrevibacter sp. TaxID=253161 RepID=UPI0025FA77D7|nr:RNA degradosome polyphosphate kinase [uncultured Methanobrevibacter sp.]
MKKRDYSYTQNRELSWLKFDERVLSEAEDESVPLLEKLRFVSIFTSNLDEFYMVRCGSLYDLTLVDKKDRDNKTNLTPRQQLNAIFKATLPLYEKRDEIFNNIIQKLRKRQIVRYKFDELSMVRKQYISKYFYEEVMPLLSAQIIDPHQPFPHLINKSLYIYSMLEVPENIDDEKSTQNLIMGLIPVPSTLPRYIMFPGTNEFILLEDLILAFTESVFSNYRVAYKTITAVTRNSDINLQRTPIDEDEDYRHYMKKILKKRKRLAPIRLEFYGDNNPKYTKPLKKELGLHKNQIFTSQTPLDLDYIEDVFKELPESMVNELTFPEFSSQYNPHIRRNKPLLDQLDEKDILLFYPYQTMNHFIDFLKEAARDPEVLSIKITLYRVAKNSEVIKYLLEALDNGKEVTVLIELRARFDEQNNIINAELLEESGVHILYGFEDYKVHSKICSVTKKHDNEIKHYTQIGTGNYNEKTASRYTDYCYLTSNEEIGEDANEFFNNLSLSNLRGHYNKFLVSPTTIRSGIIDLIDNEIDKAKNNQPAEILMKMNSITDRKIIDKLAEASQCGVPIKMIIRGICCIIPGIPGKTENIEIKGIVGRYLEHSRVYAFGKGEDRILYISSADIMTRNTAKRVEIACPIEDPEIKSRILEDLDIMFKDDIKGRKINDHGDYEKIIQEEHINSQEFFQERAIKEMKDYKYDEEDIKFGVMKGRTIQNNANPKNDDKTSKQLEETKLKLEETQNELDNLKIEFNELKEELEKSIKVSNKISDELKEIKSLTEKQAEEVTIKDAVLIQSSNTKNDGGGFFSKIKNLFK